MLDMHLCPDFWWVGVLVYEELAFGVDFQKTST